MRMAIFRQMKKGVTVEELRRSLDGQAIDGVRLKVGVDHRSLPWMDHVVDGFVDGPPSSNVAVVFSGREPGRDLWRRFTIDRVGPGEYEVDVFPTPFRNAIDPLSPGIPPGASKPR
jgi:hypothetical protein